MTTHPLRRSLSRSLDRARRRRADKARALRRVGGQSPMSALADTMASVGIVVAIATISVAGASVAFGGVQPATPPASVSASYNCGAYDFTVTAHDRASMSDAAEAITRAMGGADCPAAR